MIRCPYCEQDHDGRYLCDVAKVMLDHIQNLARTHDVAQREYDEPSLLKGERPGDALVRQFMVMAALVPVTGVLRGALVFTGETASGTPLPRWLFIGSDQEIRGVVKLVEDNANLAIRRAVLARRQEKGQRT